MHNILKLSTWNSNSKKESSSRRIEHLYTTLPSLLLLNIAFNYLNLILKIAINFFYEIHKISLLLFADLSAKRVTQVYFQDQDQNYAGKCWIKKLIAEKTNRK